MLTVRFECDNDKTKQNTPRQNTTAIKLPSQFTPRLSFPPLFTSTPRHPATPYPQKTSTRKSTDHPCGISKADIRRMAREAGVFRMGKGVHEMLVEILESFLQKIMADVAICCDYYERKTVMVEDIYQALQRQGRRVYGMD